MLEPRGAATIDRREFVRSVLTGGAAAAVTRARAGASVPSAQEACGDGESYWSHLRWQSLIPKDQACFDTGTLGASLWVVVEAVADHLRCVEEPLALWDCSADPPERLAGYHPDRGVWQKPADDIHADYSRLADVDATVAIAKALAAR